MPPPTVPAAEAAAAMFAQNLLSTPQPHALQHPYPGPIHENGLPSLGFGSLPSSGLFTAERKWSHYGALDSGPLQRSSGQMPASASQQGPNYWPKQQAEAHNHSQGRLHSHNAEVSHARASSKANSEHGLASRETGEGPAVSEARSRLSQIRGRSAAAAGECCRGRGRALLVPHACMFVPAWFVHGARAKR